MFEHKHSEEFLFVMKQVDEKKGSSDRNVGGETFLKND